MKSFFKKPYTILWICIISFAVYREFRLSKNDIVYNYYDTYFVIAQRHYTILLAIVLFVISLVYLFSEKLHIKLYPRLNIIHLTLTIIPTLASPLIKLYYEKKCGEFPLFDYCDNLDFYTEILVVSFLIAQLILIVNLSVSIIKVIQRKIK